MYRENMIQQEGARLMLITHRTARLTEYEEARLAIEGGCRWVQLRMKGTLNLDDARRLSVLCKERNTLLCIDDDVEIALASGAGGVHVGKNDMPVAEVWEHVRAAGRERDFIVGATANTFEDIRRAAALEIADYEDALQCAQAMRIKADFIITRNIKDLKNSAVPALTPGAFLSRFFGAVS